MTVSDNQHLARQLAVSFQTGSVCDSVVQGLSTLLPTASLVSVSISSGPFLVSAANLLQTGFHKLSIFRLDQTAAAAAIRSHACFQVRHGECRAQDVASAHQTCGSTAIACVPVHMPCGGACGEQGLCTDCSGAVLTFGSDRVLCPEQLAGIFELAAVLSAHLPAAAATVLGDLRVVLHPWRDAEDRDVELERGYLRWHNAGCANLDLYFQIIAIIIVTATCFMEPFKLTANFPCAWPGAYYFMVPLLVRTLYPRRYLEWREPIIASCLAWYGTYVPHVLAINFILANSEAKRTSLMWLPRETALEALSILPLGYLVRFRSFLPVQVYNAAVIIGAMPAKCEMLWPGGAWPGCFSAFAAVMVAVGVVGPACLIWYNETRARRAYVASLQAGRDVQRLTAGGT
ncbi:hypothetical protein WJX72_005729 [[Myrmecia] bisecta]|uniref:Uncharacterized protein n=1 Tax=[Myrmecia] bisecta TaxID=41462 RepID=A0AAW1P8B4_9CHLO